MSCTRETQDFPTLADAVAHLEAAGFVKASHVDEHFRYPVRKDDGFVQRADAFVPHNMNIGRVAYWPAIA